MFLNTHSIPKYMMVGFIVVTMFFGITSFAPRAQAQTDNAAVLEQIAALMEMVQMLQAQLAELQASSGNTSIEGGFDDKDFGIGDTVKTTDVLRVRSFSGTNAGLVGNVPAYTSGTIHNGPHYADGYAWWYVVYSNGTSGWSAANWLRGIQSPSTPTPSKVNIVDEEQDEDDLNPEITLTYPKKGVVFDKAEKNDDIVIKWKAEDVPANTKITYEIEVVQAYAGAFNVGSAGRVLTTDGRQGHRIAIDGPGRLSPGEYRVRLSIEDCHSLGCNYNYSSGPLKEDLKVYDRSSYGYFTVIDSEAASVTLRAEGQGGKEIFVEAGESITFSYSPVGNIDECTVTSKYEGISYTQEHSWPNTILINQYGRATFSTGSSGGFLEEVIVECFDEDGDEVASDSITVNVANEGERHDYELTINGKVEYEKDDVTSSEALVQCYADVNDWNMSDENRYDDVARCYWDDEEIYYQDGWKG